jgi:hypothetical protein
MRVRQAHVGYGDLGIGGDLGYGATMTGDRVMLPPRIPFGQALSAHAPSEIIVELDQPAAIRGALNASAALWDGGACEFWINDHWIGDLTSPCQVTPPINVAAGVHRLRSRAAPTNWGAHSLWLFNENRSFRARVALVTIACYPEDRVKEEARWLFASAARVGWLVHAFGVGSSFENMYQTKVERLAGWIRSLPDHYKHVVYLDARDAFVFGTEEEVRSRLNWPVLIGMESGPWPEQSENWASALRGLAHHHHPQTALAYINAGMFAGEREAVVVCLGNMIQLRRNWLAGHGPDWLNPYRHFHDDQFLWQAYYRLDPSSIQLDSKAELLCNMSWQHLELAHKDIRPGDRRVTTRYETEPCFLHFSGPGTPNLPHWFHWLLG